MKQTSTPSGSAVTSIENNGSETPANPLFTTSCKAAEAGGISVAREEEQMPGHKFNKKPGIAMGGPGKYSKEQLATDLRETKPCRLTGIVTGSPHKAEEWKREYSIPEGNVYDYANFDRIQDNADVDIVYVVLPMAFQDSLALLPALPMHVKGLYVHGWRINDNPNRLSSEEEFLNALRIEFPHTTGRKSGCNEAFKIDIRKVITVIRQEALARGVTSTRSICFLQPWKLSVRPLKPSNPLLRSFMKAPNIFPKYNQ